MIAIKMDHKVKIWENSCGMMFCSWLEYQDSVIDPDVPGNLQCMADWIGTPLEVVKSALRKWENEKREV